MLEGLASHAQCGPGLLGQLSSCHHAGRRIISPRGLTALPWPAYGEIGISDIIHLETLPCNAAGGKELATSVEERAR